jgi:lupus La protein
MSDLKVEAVEAVEAPTKVITSTKDETIKEDVGPVIASEKVEDVKDEPKGTENNGSSNIKEEDVKNEKFEEKDGVRTYNNGILKTSRKADDSGDFKNNSKYDPSVLPETDNAQEIRNQVCSNRTS